MRESQSEYLEIRRREAENKRYFIDGNGRAAAPHTLCLTVNNRCAFRCKHCDIGIVNEAKDGNLIDEMYYSSRFRKTDEYQLFPIERLKELIGELSEYETIIKTNFIEPLMYPHLPELIKTVKDAGLKYYTITNGWKLKQSAEFLVDLGANLIRVSVDGPPDVHDFVRGRPGSFDRCMEGIEALIMEKEKRNAVNPILGICCCISDHTYEHIGGLMDELERRGLLRHLYVNFNHLMYTTQWEVEKTLDVQPTYTHMRRCSVDGTGVNNIDPVRLAEVINDIYKRYPQDDYHYYFSPWLKDDDFIDFYDANAWMFKGTPCYLPWQTGQVEINGDIGVYGHCILPKFGNIMNNNFMDVWNSEDAMQIRLDLRDVGSYAGCNRCIGTLYPLRGRD